MVSVDFNDLFNKYHGNELEYRDIDCVCDVINSFTYYYSLGMSLKEILNDSFMNACKMNNIRVSYLNGKFNVNGYEFWPIYSGKALKKRIILDENNNKKYVYSGSCHCVTLSYLKNYGFNNASICAVTSIVRDITNTSIFHSYIWDKDKDIIIDYAGNYIMKKSDYDKLFVIYEIQVLNYDDFLFEFGDFDDSLKLDNVAYRLLFLSLIKLALKEIKMNNV